VQIPAVAQVRRKFRSFRRFENSRNVEVWLDWGLVLP
jgi:hypothetical protein